MLYNSFSCIENESYNILHTDKLWDVAYFQLTMYNIIDDYQHDHVYLNPHSACMGEWDIDVLNRIDCIDRVPEQGQMWDSECWLGHCA